MSPISALPDGVDPEPLAGRSMLVRKTEVVPIECVVRGYLSGSGWKEYQQSGTVCGVRLPAGLTESDRLPEPIFTPATKEETGHDINISFDRMVEIVGRDVAEELRRRSLAIYQRGAELARQRGIIIADTKFEWGRVDGELILIDEVLTPDSSRFWPADQYRPGQRSAVVRQAVRPRLAGNDRLGQKQPAAGAARRRGRSHAGKVHRSVRAADRAAVCVEVNRPNGRRDSTYLRFWCESTIVVCGARFCALLATTTHSARLCCVTLPPVNRTARRSSR